MMRLKKLVNDMNFTLAILDDAVTTSRRRILISDACVDRNRRITVRFDTIPGSFDNVENEDVLKMVRLERRASSEDNKHLFVVAQLVAIPAQRKMFFVSA